MVYKENKFTKEKNVRFKKQTEEKPVPCSCGKGFISSKEMQECEEYFEQEVKKAVEIRLNQVKSD